MHVHAISKHHCDVTECWSLLLALRCESEASQRGMKVCSLIVLRQNFKGGLQTGIQQRQCLHTCTWYQAMQQYQHRELGLVAGPAP